MQPERDHNFNGENSYAREFRGKRMRASRNGWFSADLDVIKGQPMGLVVEYWAGFPGSTTLDILVDGELMATEDISNKKDGHFINKIYEIPDAMTVDIRRSVGPVSFSSHHGPLLGSRPDVCTHVRYSGIIVKFLGKEAGRKSQDNYNQYRSHIFQNSSVKVVPFSLV